MIVTAGEGQISRRWSADFPDGMIKSYPIQDFPDTILSSFPEPLDTPPRFCYTPCKNPGGVAAERLKGKTWEKRTG